MLAENWWELLEEKWDDIIELVGTYHPTHGKIRTPKEDDIMAEQACEVVRKRLRVEQPGDNVGLLKSAVQAKNYPAARKILSATWFGVPEERASRSLPGFFDLCDLLDDPIEAPGEFDEDA